MSSRQTNVPVLLSVMDASFENGWRGTLARAFARSKGLPDRRVSGARISVRAAFRAMLSGSMADPGAAALRRLLADASAGGQAKTDALTALSQRTLFVPT